MNKILYYILFIILFLFSNNVFAINNKYNTENNISKAILIEDYVDRHKTKIVEFVNKYDISDNDVLNKNLDELNESIAALKKIQNINIEKNKAEEVINAVIQRIKKINTSLEKQLKIEKKAFQARLYKKKDTFARLGLQIASKIDNINKKIANNILKNNPVLSLKESKIKKILIELNKESQKLKNFWNTDYKSEKDIKDSFVKILKKIKLEINSMKNSLK